MSRLARIRGIVRSAATYYAVPFRARRMQRLYAEFIRDGSLGFDIGAHLGNRIRCWRRLGARVVAVEPQANLFALLEQMYGADPAVTLLRQALGAEPGEATLYVSERHPTVTTLSDQWIERVRADPSFSDVAWSPGERTEVSTLQTLIDRFGLPDFVKIDVEGYEAEVLSGLSTPLPALSFEYLPVVRHLALECIERLSRLGDYRYNRSTGERHRFESADWLDAQAMSASIAALPGNAPSGDVYARLVNARHGIAAGRGG